MHIMEGRKGDDSRDVAVYDLEQRRLIDEECTRRTIDFMKRSVAAGKPFYAYVPFTQVHFPTLPNPRFAGANSGHDCWFPWPGGRAALRRAARSSIPGFPEAHKVNIIQVQYPAAEWERG